VHEEHLWRVICDENALAAICSFSGLFDGITRPPPPFGIVSPTDIAKLR
jgi:hypothetical protein